MIITCNNCNKKFEIDANLIPVEGRLLQCSSCDHKWFFKNEATSLPISSLKKENQNIFENKEIKKNVIFNDDKKVNIIDNTGVTEETATTNTVINKNKPTKKTNFLNLIIVIAISFAALILLIDTFKYPLSSIFPNIEFLLYNLYESTKDIELFFKDLIKTY